MGEAFVGPRMGSSMRVVTSTAQTGGERVVVEFTLEPNAGGPPLHEHPGQTEAYEVLEGTLALRVGGEEIRLGPGESATVPPGTAHTFWNPTAATVRMTSTHTPALGFERYMKTMYDLDYDGRTNAQGVPRNPLQLGVLIATILPENRLVGPPVLAQRILMGTLSALGRALGYRPVYESSRRTRGLPPAAVGDAGRVNHDPGDVDGDPVADGDGVRGA